MSSHTLTLATVTVFPFSDPRRQQSSQAAIPPAQLLSPSHSDLRSLGDSHTFGIVYTIVDLTLGIRVILLEWVILFKNPTVIVFNRVTIFIGSM